MTEFMTALKELVVNAWNKIKEIAHAIADAVRSGKQSAKFEHDLRQTWAVNMDTRKKSQFVYHKPRVVMRRNM